MNGPPKDKPGECNAHLYIGDDYGDNRATMRCQLEAKHVGSHEEKYTSHTKGEVVVTWEIDERQDEDDEDYPV